MNGWHFQNLSKWIKFKLQQIHQTTHNFNYQLCSPGICHNWTLPFFLVGCDFIFGSTGHCFEKVNQALLYSDKHQYHCYNQIQFYISLPRIVKMVLDKGKQWSDKGPTKLYSISSILIKFQHISIKRTSPEYAQDWGGGWPHVFMPPNKCRNPCL